jgi:molybdenum cofactor cytidylyltransferase
MTVTHASSVIIPAAGASSRMGSPKPKLRLQNGNTFAGYLLKVYAEFGADPVVIIVNKESDLKGCDNGTAIVVENNHVDLGRSYSIKLGLMKTGNNRKCFIQNIDNPYFDKSLLTLLLGNIQEDSYLIPVFNGKGGHPVLLGEKIIADLKGKDPFGDFREVLSCYKRIEIPWSDPGILLNINSPSDYRKYISG